jgi:hypothetical protein
VHPRTGFWLALTCFVSSLLVSGAVFCLSGPRVISWLFGALAIVAYPIAIWQGLVAENASYSKKVDTVIRGLGTLFLIGATILAAEFGPPINKDKVVVIGLKIAGAIAIIYLIAFGIQISQRSRAKAVVTANASSSLGFAVAGIASFLVFSYAVKQVFHAHNALSRSRAPSIFLRRDSVDEMKLLLEAQSYSTDRMFWAFIAFVALGAAVGCLVLKQKK